MDYNIFFLRPLAPFRLPLSPSSFPLSYPKSRIISLQKGPNHGLMGESLSQPRAFGVSVAHRSAPQCTASREAPSFVDCVKNEQQQSLFTLAARASSSA